MDTESMQKTKQETGDYSDVLLSNARERYTSWICKLKGHGLFPIEHLLPTITTPCPNTLPELMRSVNTPEDYTTLQQQVRKLGPWGYGIQLCENVVTEKMPVALERMIYRSHLITDTVCDILGDNLSKTTVLDMACNHGYFSLEVAFRGAQHAVGVDLRPENIDKANFLKTHFNVTNAQFSQSDIYDLDSNEKYDVVYNLGLFYHVTDPYRLMQKTYDMCNQFAVIDSIMHKEPVSAFMQMVNKNTDLHAEGEFSVELHPTYRAIIDLMHSVGFSKIVEIIPEDSANRVPHELYDRHDRRCLIGFKNPL